jgi:hypothetical protein
MTNALFKPKILNAQEYGGSVCPKCQQPIGEGQMRSWDGGSEAHLTCPPPQQQDRDWQSPILKAKLPVQRQPEIRQPARQSHSESAVASISSDGRRWEKIGTRKAYSGTRPSHARSFGVASDSANLLAMALAEAEIRDFEVATDYDNHVSYFTFSTPADRAMASDLLSKKLAPQILLW